MPEAEPEALRCALGVWRGAGERWGGLGRWTLAPPAPQCGPRAEKLGGGGGHGVHVAGEKPECGLGLSRGPEFRRGSSVPPARGAYPLTPPYLHPPRVTIA